MFVMLLNLIVISHLIIPQWGFFFAHNLKIALEAT